MNILEIIEKKGKAKISMVTCYDYTSARIAANSPIDMLLVGDSLVMTMHGETTTLPATVDLMALHTRAVVKAAPKKFVVGDLPFMSFRSSLSENVENVRKLMAAGCQAVKLEGAKGNLELIRHLVDSGVPVMGHLGLTPQSINQLGGFKVQGRNETAKKEILKQAKELEAAGCFSLVLECVPSDLAKVITAEISIPTIGIGAGPDVDGQVLVWQDMLGMNPDFKPKFLRKYLNGADLIGKALENYHDDVVNGKFPSPEESYS